MKPARRPRSSPGGARALLLLTALLALPRCTRPAQAQGDTARTALPQGFARGISYAHDWSQHGVRGYGTESDRAELARVRAMGATWVSVMPFGYLSGPASTALRTSYDRPGAERDEALRATIRWYLDEEAWWRAVLDGSYRRAAAPGDGPLGDLMS